MNAISADRHHTTPIDIARTAADTQPLTPTLELLSTETILGAIRAAAVEISRRVDSAAVKEHLIAIIHEADDLEPLLDALPTPPAPARLHGWSGEPL